MVGAQGLETLDPLIKSQLLLNQIGELGRGIDRSPGYSPAPRLLFIIRDCRQLLPPVTPMIKISL
jgi:hypothetical protein